MLHSDSPSTTRAGYSWRIHALEFPALLWTQPMGRAKWRTSRTTMVTITVGYKLDPKFTLLLLWKEVDTPPRLGPDCARGHQHGNRADHDTRRRRPPSSTFRRRQLEASGAHFCANGLPN